MLDPQFTVAATVFHNLEAPEKFLAFKNSSIVEAIAWRVWKARRVSARRKEASFFMLSLVKFGIFVPNFFAKGGWETAPFRPS